MPLPKHINLANCAPDPFGRANHIYHAATEEVLHVDRQTAQKVGKAAEKAADAAGVAVPQSAAVVTDDETGMTIASEDGAAETTETPAPPDEIKDEDSADRAELLRMAESLDLTVPEGMGDADLLSLIEQAIQSDKPVQTAPEVSL